MDPVDKIFEKMINSQKLGYMLDETLEELSF